jgi:hypothetical protein
VGESREVCWLEVDEVEDEVEEVDRRRSTNMTGIAGLEDEELDR